MMKTIFSKATSQLVILLCTFLFVTGCLQSPNSKRAVVKSASTNNSKTPTKVPDFTTGNNFIQNGSSVHTSSVYLDLSFDDYIVLRGKDVDNYIRLSGTQNVTCLTSNFTHATVNKIIVLAAVPRSFYNFTTQTLEYYYNISPSDASSNQSFCQKTGLVNQLFSLYRTLTPQYKLKDLCPTSGTCLQTYVSEGMQLFSSSGALLTQVLTSNLKFSISSTTASGGSSGINCVENTQCTSQGYDCCSLGQCVKDLALKPGVNTSLPEYAQALQDILNNPSNIYSYPQYYFICSEQTNVPTNPTTPTDPVIDAGRRLQRLKDLYNCTTKIEGEYGVCTKTYPNAEVGNTYSAGDDDRSFKETFTHLTVSPKTLVSIEQVSYGEVVLFNYASKSADTLFDMEYDEPTSLVRIDGINNDDLASSAKIKVKSQPPGAVSKELVIKYKIDASCSPINPTIAKCEKHYTQGQDNFGGTAELNRRGRVTDHFPDSNVFKLPQYANTSKAITVEVDGVIQREGTDWQLVIGSPSIIQFLPTNVLKVFKDQKVKITFFSRVAPDALMPSKMAALNEIKTICGCNEVNCTLTPVKNMANIITDYACVFPEPNLPPPPMTQKVYLSSKTVPVRFFDSNGISQSTINSGTLPQEGGFPFQYRKDNLHNPNNLPDINNPPDTTNISTNYYIGFNEIYGSLSYSNNSAKPAKEVSVKKGTTYDIFVDRGTFSTCIQCGNDYFSILTKNFPFTEYGGGLTPLQSQTNTITGNTIRSSELAFGRACVVPASMIPWSHHPESQQKEQRLGRMRSQHFLYANGYQYDWYGFDYGAVIGSFDGVKWFAIGTNRRIKADTNKLFIAVNGPFGDLTIDSTYEVTINDASLNPDGSNMVTRDFDSDGAQCQRYHQCNTDNDCATTLGWDYACAPVNQITTSWPKFDENAKEVPDTSNDVRSLTSILGLSSTGKRCVYRGRGSLCTQNYQTVGAATFNESTEKVFHACSSNNYCQPIISGGAAVNKFNNRIVRFGKVKADSTIDSFGFGARIPGRPFNYQGLEAVRAETLKNLNGNKALAMCVPGKDPTNDTFIGQNTSAPASANAQGDKILGIGMTLEGQTKNNSYLMSCSVFDSSKNYHYLTTNPSSSKSTNNTLKFDSGTQSLPTNSLEVINKIFQNKKITFGLLKNNSEVLTGISYTQNRCLRAPGASCFSDIECGPSKTLSDKLKAISADDTAVTDILNKYEVKFWQEELICSQEVEKTNSSYDPKNNRCCREIGKTISIGSSSFSIPIDTSSVPGIDINLNNEFRYSRTSTVYKEMKTDSSNYPPLSVSDIDQCSYPFVAPATSGCQPSATLANQYKTFAAIAERTSCSGDWVRSFATGTTKWEAGRLQKFDPKIFQCYNWLPGPNNYSCEGIEEDNPECRIVQTSPSSAKAKGVLDYLGRLELMGVPQIALETLDYYQGVTEKEMSCRSFPGFQSNPYPGSLTAPAANYKAPVRLFHSDLPVASQPVAEYESATGVKMYSAADKTNFKPFIKTIFKADEVRGCFPAGTQMNAGDNPDLCCTGFINGTNNKCQLLDLVDISVYTNRYISSEAKKLNLTLFDANGYVKDPYYVAQLACQKQFCASGVVGMGTLISQLKIPGRASDAKSYRFLEGATVDSENGLQELFNAGLKLNNHAYCLPKSFSGQANEDFTIISCGN